MAWKKVPTARNHLLAQGFCKDGGWGTCSARRTYAGKGFGIETMTERKPMGQQTPMEATAQRNKKANARPAKLGREVQARLGQQLRAMYDEVVKQGVPERFTELLNRLDGNGNKDSN
jgi:hypothetical protein